MTVTLPAAPVAPPSAVTSLGVGHDLVMEFRMDQDVLEVCCTCGSRLVTPNVGEAVQYVNLHRALVDATC